MTKSIGTCVPDCSDFCFQLLYRSEWDSPGRKLSKKSTSCVANCDIAFEKRREHSDTVANCTSRDLLSCRIHETPPWSEHDRQGHCAANQQRLHKFASSHEEEVSEVIGAIRRLTSCVSAYSAARLGCTDAMVRQTINFICGNLRSQLRKKGIKIRR